MERLTYRTIDKSTWPRGAWDDEPDKEQWADPETGLPCLIVRGRAGAWCGYVGVPPNHPWYRQDYYDIAEVDIHGGLTYSDLCMEGSESTSICHIPGPGEPDHVWWLGFDAAHAWDLVPAYVLKGLTMPGATYRNAEYMRRECARLAAQIDEAQSPLKG